MNDTKPQILRDLLASGAMLERNLQDAMALAGEHSADVEPILKKVQSIFAEIENSTASADNSVDFRTMGQSTLT